MHLGKTERCLHRLWTMPMESVSVPVRAGSVLSVGAYRS